ncbi:unnamed protein product [Closterium sp. NIES-54]
MDLGDAHPSLRYVLTLKDDYTNYLWVAPLARRSDMAAVFSTWRLEMKTKLPTKPLAALRTDNGGEYTANAFTDYLSCHGIVHQTSLPHTPQQNGVAERVNRTLMDRVRAMTTGASLSSKFWPYALEYAAWLHNRSFGKFEQRGRAGMFLGLSNSRKAWIVRDLASDVDTDTCSARFFDDLMLPDAESVLECQRYLEEVSPHIDGWTSGGEGFGSEFDSFPASPPSPTSPTDTSTTQGQEVDATQEDSPIDDAAETGEGAAASDLPPAGVSVPSVPEVAEGNEMEYEASHLYDFAYPPDGIKLAAHDTTPRRVHFNPNVTVLGGERQGTDSMTGLDVLFGKRQAAQAFNKLPNLQQHVLGCSATGVPMVDLTYKEPKSLKEMTTDQYAHLWQAAVDTELAKFDELDAYEVVDRADIPKGTPVLTEGVVLRVKRDEHGQPNHFKARWVVKGCGQTWGTFDETYAPVSQGPTSRMFIAGAFATKRKVGQLDISNAFLYAPIDRDSHASVAAVTHQLPEVARSTAAAECQGAICLKSSRHQQQHRAHCCRRLTGDRHVTDAGVRYAAEVRAMMLGAAEAAANTCPQQQLRHDDCRIAHNSVTAPACAAPHSSSFPPTEAPLQTLHLDVWGPARVRGQGHERYFLLVVDDYTRYTTVFPLQRKGDVPDVLIPWIHATRLQLRERFQSDFSVLRLHSDRGGEFSSDLLEAFCAEHGICQTFTLPASPQQNGVAERHIGLVMEVARTSMIHAAAPHFLWLFAVWYAAHQLNLWPRVSLPETSPTLLWTGKVGVASRFRVWGARAFVRDTTADKLSPCAVPCDVNFDESVPFYRLFPYRTAPRPPPRYSFSPQVDPPAPAPVEVTGDSDPAASGAVPRGAELGGAESGGAEREEPGGAASGGAASGGAEPACAEPGGAESGGESPEGSATAFPRSPWSSRLRPRVPLTS